jgi:hypothetical protein
MLLGSPPGGFAYFNSYGQEAPAMWHRFRESLVSVAASAGADAIIRSANDTYARIYNWHCEAEG